ncbi:pentapeptide repeat-containing protein [Agromyces albus]|uniref:Pentapeptide repeat-containing protein n=1 Tax=Agromyces albus TaxID=205332 RepID=A0A4Q2L8D1_9MICO|nr:pentapeptide repeat-containing protein [Agromyces albus]RXZ72782.1 pentapeptide repeat-containing protein [Agromyces albus]
MVNSSEGGQRAVRKRAKASIAGTADPNAPERSDSPRSQWWKPDPHTIGNDIISGIVAGAVVGVTILVAQFYVEDQRIAREENREDAQIAREHVREDEQVALATRLENLRFVRALSSIEPMDRPFRGLDLEDMDLSGLNLNGADFSESNLRGARLEDTRLAGVDLHGADLTGADLSRADLSGADLVGTTFEDANFSMAHLRGATIGKFNDAPASSAAIWNDADLSGAVMSTVDFSRTDRLWSRDLLGATIVGPSDLSTVRIIDEVDPPNGGPLNVRYCVSPDVALPTNVRDATPDADHEDCAALHSRYQSLALLYARGDGQTLPGSIDPPEDLIYRLAATYYPLRHRVNPDYVLSQEPG